jgi:serine protease Do
LHNKKIYKMDDIILLDAIERYIDGTMDANELAHFEHLRTINPEIDQLIVEHKYFLKIVGEYGDRKAMKSQMDSIHAELITNHEISTTSKETEKGKVVGIFGKYKKQMAVAATVAALVAITGLGLAYAFWNSKINSEFETVKQDLKNTQDQVRNNEEKINARDKKAAVSKIQASTSGTGFIVNDKGYIITNLHVVDKTDQVYVFNERYGDLTGLVVLRDESNDLAVIKITDTTVKLNTKLPYKLNTGSTILGKDVFTMNYARPELMFTQGYISSKDAYGKYGDGNNFLLTLNAEGGNSGSPIFNKKGEIIGVITAKEKIENGYTVGIKATALQNIMNVLGNEVKGKSILNNKPTIANLDIADQTSRIEDFIFMVKVK